MSIDVEGFELEVMKTVDFDKVKAHIITYEFNHGEKDDKVNPMRVVDQLRQL